MVRMDSRLGRGIFQCVRVPETFAVQSALNWKRQVRFYYYYYHVTDMPLQSIYTEDRFPLFISYQSQVSSILNAIHPFRLLFDVTLCLCSQRMYRLIYLTMTMTYLSAIYALNTMISS